MGGRATMMPISVSLIYNAESNEEFDLSIMHTNDSHAHVEGYPKLVTAVNELRAEKDECFVIGCWGCLLRNTLFPSILGLADLWFMNELGYDAMTLGNHEFDKDSKTLSRLSLKK